MATRPTKAQQAKFWRRMEAAFRALMEEGELRATRNPDGYWTIHGRPDLVARYRVLAAVAGRAAQGQFPSDMKIPSTHQRRIRN